LPIGVEFTRPIALALLLLVVVFVAIDRFGIRARTRARRYGVLGVRILGFTCLVLALAAPVVWTGGDDLSTVFLLDRSASVPPAQQQAAIDWIQRAIQAKHATDRAAVIGFAGDAAVEQDLSSAPPAIAPTANLDRSHTDIAAALRLAQGVLPASGARRIVLLSDGGENRGSALGEAGTLRAAGIPVDVVPIAATSGPDVAVRGVSLPPAVHKGEKFTLNVSIDSTVETSAQLHLSIDGRLDSTQSLQLHPGENSLVFGHDALPPGEHAVEVRVEAARDTIAENNVGYATLEVAGPPRVLLVEGDAGAARYVQAALTADGLTVDVEAPSILTGDVASLRQYDAIGLVNVPATRIGASGLIALQSYVRDFGGGLVTIGGDRSFGVGGYRNTPLEDVLPVSMDVRGRASHANIVLLLVIDVSGSMSEGPPGATKIELARQAAAGSIAQLSSGDQVGIIAFDDQNHWIHPTAFLTDPQSVQADIARLEPGGGTEIYPALLAAYDDIVQRPGKIKHILMMTDGLAPNGDYEGLTARMREKGVTLSTIAIGTDADLNLLQNLADWGRGRYYDASDPVDVPRFVIKETTEVARAAIAEETFTPTVVDQTPVLDSVTALPKLYGYVATTAKSSAVVGLESPEHDPILAQWQVGLGRAVAFTSDASARWSSDWVSWTDFGQFWTRVFKWVVPSPQDQNLQVQTSVAAGRAHIVVDATAADGRYVDNATATALVVRPPAATPPSAVLAGSAPAASQSTTTVALTQSAPGRYEGDVPADQQGSYLVQVSLAAPGQATPSTQSHGFTLPYSSEYSGSPADLGFLRQLAQATDGSVLTAPADSFAHNLRLAESARPVWPYLIACLVPLFLLDVALRRLRFTPADLAPVFERVGQRWRGQTGRAAALAHRLRTARETTRPAAPRPVLRPTVVAARRAAATAPTYRSVPRAAVAPVPDAPAGNRLLNAKRRATPPTRAARG
jgi:Mg-chelatase subunit ChlD